MIVSPCECVADSVDGGVAFGVGVEAVFEGDPDVGVATVFGGGFSPGVGVLVGVVPGFGVVAGLVLGPGVAGGAD